MQFLFVFWAANDAKRSHHQNFNSQKPLNNAAFMAISFVFIAQIMCSVSANVVVVAGAFYLCWCWVVAVVVAHLWAEAPAFTASGDCNCSSTRPLARLLAFRRSCCSHALKHSTFGFQFHHLPPIHPTLHIKTLKFSNFRKSQFNQYNRPLLIHLIVLDFKTFYYSHNIIIIIIDAPIQVDSTGLLWL